jgi:hypothetical protein
MISFVNTKKAAGTGGNSQEAPALIALSDLGTGLTTFYDLFRDVPEMNEPSNFQLSPFTFHLSTFNRGNHHSKTGAISLSAGHYHCAIDRQAISSCELNHAITTLLRK